MKLVGLLLFAALALSAQSYVPFKAGALSCGLVERASNSVQVFCYDANRTLLYNTIQTIGPTTDIPGLTIKFIWGGTDGFWAVFNVSNNIINYEIISNTSLVGILTSIYGATGQGCSLISPASPNFTWKVDPSKQCTTTWADAWFDCCAGIAQ